MDPFSRFIVGCAPERVDDRRLTLKALRDGCPATLSGRGLLHHSDHGSTYTCEDYQAMPATHRFLCSMSRQRRVPRQRRAPERFFASVAKDSAIGFEFRRSETALFDYIDVFYNQRRRRSMLRRISPAAFEA